MNNPWTKTKEEVLKELHVNPETGLSTDEVLRRQNKFGLNKLPEEKLLSPLLVFLNQFKSPLIYILVIAGTATLFLKELTDTIVIFSAVFLNTLVGFLQEFKAEKALGSLKKVLKHKAVVLRNNGEKEILQEEVVPGDILILKAGDKVPADGRLIEIKNFKVNESILSGEWQSAEKKTAKLEAKTPLADRDNMVYMGTMVEDGQGKAVVTKIGEGTEIGKIAQLVKETKEEKTPYQKKLIRFSKLISLILVTICSLIFIQGLLTGGGFIEIFTTSVAVVVAAIPEGLPVAITIILALGMQRILKRKGLVRKLASAETLGSTSIILTDKTGSLTEAKMKLANIFPQKAEKLALKIAVLANEAFVENRQQPVEKWIIRGDPTEKALIQAGGEKGIFRHKLEKKEPQIDFLPFNPVNKYAATLHQLSSKEKVIYLKGAPEKILDLANYIEVNGQPQKLTLKKRKELKAKSEELAAKGQRILSVGYKKLDARRYTLEARHLKDLVFVALVALHDPLRKEAKSAIRACFQAGIQPIIVTGDHLLTARAIAGELDLPIKTENLLESKNLETLSEEEFQKRLDKISVYARVEPSQKLKIAQAWQERGKVVAMTGDGVNDAPALKKANIGVALGSGTEVAKEISDLVLLDDNFSTIVAAIEEGRAIIDNIRKVITYLLSDSFTEVILVGVSVLFGFPLPVTAAQILWVNLIEDTLPNIALSFEPKEKELMKRKPEDPHSSLLTAEMKTIIFVIGLMTDFFLLGLAFWLLKNDHSLIHVRTMIFAALAIDSLFYVFSCKSLKENLWQFNPFSNQFLVVAWAVSVLMLFLAIYSPIFQILLKTIPLRLNDWLIIFSLGLIELILVETTKWYFITKKEL